LNLVITVQKTRCQQDLDSNSLPGRGALC
jgi:hypothetical protein